MYGVELLGVCVTILVLFCGVLLRVGVPSEAVLLGVMALIALVVLGVVVETLRNRRQLRRERAFKMSIEARYPGMRVGRIAENKWRVDDPKSGRLECVLAEDGVTVLSIRGQSVRT
jgi:hypothetical protein